MSHISSGDLHAYLDGALDEFSTLEAARIREHLDACGECVERLNEERLLRDEANAILGGALPAINMPPFEELRARAAATSAPVKAPTGRSHLYWAASVMLALAVGYGVRGSGSPENSTQVAGAEDVVPVQQLAAAPTEDLAGEATTEGAEAPARAVTPGLSAGAAMEQVVATASRAAVSASPGVVVAQAVPVFEAPPSPAAPIDEIVTDLSGRVGLGDIAESGKVAFRAASEVGVEPAAVGVEVVPATSEVRRTVLGDVTADAAARGRSEESDAGARRERTRTPVVSAIRQSAEGTRVVRPREATEDVSTDADEGSMVVPGLDVVSISWLAEGVVAGGVQVEQTLEDGGRLILLHLPEGVLPADVPSEAEDGEWELVVPRGRGWLILRAERSIDELTELAARLDGEGQE